MKTKASLSALVVAPIVIAIVSLLVMVCLTQVDHIVHGVLYDFGLIFSYRWAMPYWVYSGIIIGLSWFNIIAAILLVRYILKRRSSLKQQEVRQTHHMEVLPSKGLNEQNERLVQLQLIDQYCELSSQIKSYDVRHPEEIVDSQC